MFETSDVEKAILQATFTGPQGATFGHLVEHTLKDTLRPPGIMVVALQQKKPQQPKWRFKTGFTDTWY